MLELVLALAAAATPSCGADDLAARFSGFDQDGDGRIEIASVEPLGARRTDGATRSVLVLVEARLLEDLDGAIDLRPRVERLANDLAAEYAVDVVSVRLAPSEGHRDGRFVLALREMLRAYDAEPSHEFAGALLVGHFPDALVVRTVNWRKHEDLVLHRGTPEEARYPDAYFLRRVAEDVARRADIVLSDLDGRWEDVYVEPRTRLETVLAVFDGKVPSAGGACVDLERGAVEFEDFFHLVDGTVVVDDVLGVDGDVVGHRVTPYDEACDHECSDSDRARPNVIPRPDVVVSRIDARGTAVSPKRSIRGADGSGLLDEAGHAREVAFASKEDVPHWRDGLYELDPLLERRLLAEFLDRNHAYRTGSADVAWRATSLAHGLGSGYGVVRRAADDWGATDRERADVAGSPTLADVVSWLEYPALLRTVRAHSDDWGSVFDKADAKLLDEACAGGVMAWTQRGEKLVPSLRAACGGGKLDWFLLRSLWESGALPDSPSFYHHTGCNGISPPGALDRAYDDPRYGVRQGGEALLFFGRGLAMVGRAKVFYDEPAGFAEALREGATFGDAWRRSFEIESNAETWGSVGGDIGRKRTLFWSVLGDWTLRLERPTALATDDVDTGRRGR
ncbi:MAG: hypothetical protein R3F34_07445 [Planctomycetota bacterium]